MQQRLVAGLILVDDPKPPLDGDPQVTHRPIFPSTQVQIHRTILLETLLNLLALFIG
ncbi:MAG: hypothetical protein IPK17_35160 [Chloroflexi bacterium]|nr:hypothetical protein [Chloroflexota bacterium]